VQSGPNGWYNPDQVVQSGPSGTIRTKWYNPDHSMRTYTEVNQCEQCGRRWISNPPPPRCPKCKSRKWAASGVRPVPKLERAGTAEPSPEPSLPDPGRTLDRVSRKSRPKRKQRASPPTQDESRTSHREPAPIRGHDYRRDIRNEAVSRPHNFHSGLRP